jgi:translation initiation factor 2 subunit 2
MSNHELFNTLLDSLYDELVESSTNTTIVILPPQLSNEPKRTLWVNAYKTAKSLHRDIEHLLKFITEELITSFSWKDHNKKRKGIIFPKRVKDVELRSILSKYVCQYVRCKSCKSSDTTLTKNSGDKLMLLECKNCRSTYHV